MKGLNAGALLAQLKHPTFSLSFKFHSWRSRVSDFPYNKRHPLITRLNMNVSISLLHSNVNNDMTIWESCDCTVVHIRKNSVGLLLEDMHSLLIRNQRNYFPLVETILQTKRGLAMGKSTRYNISGNLLFISNSNDIFLLDIFLLIVVNSCLNSAHENIRVTREIAK